ncbi:hypothetical protein [Sphingopyxis flava]|uniref:Uncharacterized protein n=1 Tax=Sphingopyxis flava TaxID=1507287 RepID=A0A1T5CKM7_9SPHN|nr:hypothetical protein [Sphingopyxis flava]SKB59964.1 hypothetical protein SAMN06295937_1010146 [Sphingopyxis flava]
MNLAPSDLPRLGGAASLSKPGFDIILAVSAARQAALPTVRLLRARSRRESRQAKVNALRAMFGGPAGADPSSAPRPARFFDLSDQKNALPETMNSPFTRGFQPMLNLACVGRPLSVEPIPPAQDVME